MDHSCSTALHQYSIRKFTHGVVS
ncbi:MAG: YSIRK-type signal peptide-containing protein [Candidatus Bathyarchaeia archaeon]